MTLSTILILLSVAAWLAALLWGRFGPFDIMWERRWTKGPNDWWSVRLPLIAEGLNVLAVVLALVGCGFKLWETFS